MSSLPGRTVVKHVTSSARAKRAGPVRRVLIYRLGSLGDTIVALPALRLIAQAFPDAERLMLTNFNINAKAAPVSQVLAGTQLIHGCIEYPIGVRNLSKLMQLRSRIRELRPDVLVYLTESRNLPKTLRDALFFRACGIRRLIGVPYTADMRTCRNKGDGMYESEGARLARCVHELGEMRPDDQAAFDLKLSSAEREAARLALGPLERVKPLLAISIGAKVDVKDWGDTNWSALLSRLSDHFAGWGLVMLGVEMERERSDALLKYWQGASLNLCGRLSVHESAAALERCRLFLGHDSGPMHLAAAVGTRCVAIFSSRNLPGEWFPYGSGHRVLYRSMPCQGCRREVCVDLQKACIRSITADEVLDAIVTVLDTKLYMQTAPTILHLVQRQ